MGLYRSIYQNDFFSALQWSQKKTTLIILYIFVVATNSSEQKNGKIMHKSPSIEHKVFQNN